MNTFRTPRMTGDRLGELIFGPEYTKITEEDREGEAGKTLDLYTDVLDTYYAMPFGNKWLAQPFQQPIFPQRQVDEEEMYTAPIFRPTIPAIPNLSQLMGAWERDLFEPSQMNLSNLLMSLFNPNNLANLSKFLGF